MLTLINSLAYEILVLALGYYLMTNLQWYSYKMTRVLFHHTKPWWHFFYFLLPFGLYHGVSYVSEYGFVVALGYVVALFFWYRHLDKPLVWTGRVKRFFGIALLFSLLLALVWQSYSLLLPLLLALLLSSFLEKMLFWGFLRKAQNRLESLEDLIVIGVTASYGKTSIKNYITHLLQKRYQTYATPRSVNTLGGVVLDINRDLPQESEVYVVEMGARGEGDIEEIATFVNPHYAIVGKIGPAHIEYFKSLENIRNTKMEILKSQRLKEAWIDASAMVKPEAHIHTYGTKEHLDIRSALPAPEYLIEEVEATLEGTSFTLNGVRYSTKILGAFNASNLAVAILVAERLGLTSQEIQEQLNSLTSVPHRLQRMDAGGKVILDDSFNGNIDGMLASFDLANTYEGRRVLMTPGLVEADEALNETVAKRANEVFDVVVVTSGLNRAIFEREVDPQKLFYLEDKAQMQEMLLEQTKAGDLILFANDAPNFI